MIPDHISLHFSEVSLEKWPADLCYEGGVYNLLVCKLAVSPHGDG